MHSSTRSVRLSALAAIGSAFLLITAFASQAFGWAPCAMCLWQRWPHAVAALAGLLLFVLPPRLVATLGGAAAATTAALGLHHSGVERDWWQGLASCTRTRDALSGFSAADLLPGGGAETTLMLCDSLTPFFLGLTMANWNAALSAGLVALWLTAFIGKPRRPFVLVNIPS